MVSGKGKKIKEIVTVASGKVVNLAFLLGS